MSSTLTESLQSPFGMFPPNFETIGEFQPEIFQFSDIFGF